MAHSNEKVDKCDAILAFLLGFTPSLCTTEHDRAAIKPTALELDSRALEPEHDVDGTNSDSDWNVTTSYMVKATRNQATTATLTKTTHQVSQGSDGKKTNNFLKATDQVDGAGPNAFNWTTSTLKDSLFVASVAAALVAYLVAITCSFFHPLRVPLPDYKELHVAYDLSNVSVHIVHPIENAFITPQGVDFEWQLVNFPAEALSRYGAEVFRYRVLVHGQILTSEIGLLALQDVDRHAMGAINRSIRFPIPLRKLTFDTNSTKALNLHLEVDLPIPGVMGESTTYTHNVNVRPPASLSLNEVYLELTSPLNGTTFDHMQSIVIEYTAVNVRTLVVLIDETHVLTKKHVNDGNMLFRRLGSGPHKLEVRALNEENEMRAYSSVHVEIKEKHQKV